MHWPYEDQPRRGPASAIDPVFPTGRRGQRGSARSLRTRRKGSHGRRRRPRAGLVGALAAALIWVRSITARPRAPGIPAWRQLAEAADEAADRRASWSGDGLTRPSRREDRNVLLVSSEVCGVQRHERVDAVDQHGGVVTLLAEAVDLVDQRQQPVGHLLGLRDQP